MHPRNLHKNSYDFDLLVQTHPSLSKFVRVNPTGRKTIDFANPEGVRTLNQALLKHYYRIDLWDIPRGYLCPPIPGRADYIHALADLLEWDTASKEIKAPSVTGLDIGTGANLIYPILGRQIYGWQFVGTDVDKKAVDSAKLIQASNAGLRNIIEIRQQKNALSIFAGVVKPSDKFVFSMCNPPFHSSEKAALMGSVQKNDNLKRNQNKRQSIIRKKPQATALSNKELLNFAGQKNELWCDGGEVGFIQRMITESIDYKNQIVWFTSLVSKKASLKPIYNMLKEENITDIKTVSMTQGSKASRFIAWRF